MKRFLLWSAGIALGACVVYALRSPAPTRKRGPAAIDLNAATPEELLALPGIDSELVDRIVENRPYRHRLDLVARRVIPIGLYQEIHTLIDVDHTLAVRPVNVAL